MIHASKYKPRIFSYNGNIAHVQINRAQNISADPSLNRTKIEEIGREDLVAWRTAIPTVAVELSQLEYGSIEIFRKIANVADSVVTVNFTDFKTSMVDIAGYKTDDDATFLSTFWYPKLRLSGFGINIGDPEALIERNFSFVGEDKITLQNNNKYLVELVDTGAAGTFHQITIGSGGYADYPSPVEDPDNSASYFLRGLRIRSGTTTEITEGTDFNFHVATNTITIPGSAASDVYKFTYSASSYITNSSTFTDNDSDLAGIEAHSCTILLETTNSLSRVQSVSLDVSLDRFDIKEVGNVNTVARGVRDITATVSIGRLLEDHTLEEVLRSVVGSSYGKIDIRKFSTAGVNLIIKLYSDSTKSTFKLGYKLTNLSPTSEADGTPVNDYVSKGATMECESGFVTCDESAL